MQIHAYFPGNLAGHSNVQAPGRRRLIEGFDGDIDVFAQAQIPLTVSFQEIDRLLVGGFPSLGPNKGYLKATLGHTLPSLYEGALPWSNHADALFVDTTETREDQVAGVFSAEFDYGSDWTRVGNPGDVAFALPSSILTKDGEHLCFAEKAGPFVIKDRVIVPMNGTKEAMDAFFAFQRHPDDESRQVALAEAIRTLGEAEGEGVCVLFLDYEAPMVGSLVGMEIWSRLFELIEKNDLAKYFVSFNEARAIWTTQAAENPLTGQVDGVHRDIGVKWTTLGPMFKWTQRVLRTTIPGTRADDLVATVFTGSDVLSALHRKLHPAIVPKDEPRIRISYDPTIIWLAKSYLDFSAKERPRSAAAIHTHTTAQDVPTGEDGAWFVRHLSEALLAEF